MLEVPEQRMNDIRQIAHKELGVTCTPTQIRSNWATVRFEKVLKYMANVGSWFHD